MQVTQLRQDDAQYPADLREPLAGHIDTLAIAGNPALLTQKAAALFCSVKCPGDLILKTYDLARALRDAEITVIGGFHSPMEKECLTLLLRGRQPIIVCLARSLEGLRLPTTWKRAMDDGRLMMVSPFDGRCRRVTRQTAEKRNRCIMSLAADIIVTYAHVGGRLEQLCRDAAIAGKTIWTLEDPGNTSLVQLGAKSFTHETLPRAWVTAAVPTGPRPQPSCPVPDTNRGTPPPAG